MKAENIKKLVDTVTAMGYEILEIIPHPYFSHISPGSPLSGAYNIRIEPLEECEIKTDEEEQLEETIKNQPVLAGDQ